MTETWNVHPLRVSEKPLSERQEGMVEILLRAMKDVRDGKVAALSTVLLLENGKTVTGWSGTSDCASIGLVGATFRLASEMATSFVEAPEDDGNEGG